MRIDFSPHVYFCREIPTGLVKIGKSCEPASRVYQLSIDRKAPMELAAAVKVKDPGEYFERYIQAHLATKQVEGEWFRLDQSEIDAAIALLNSIKKTKVPQDRAAWPYCPWRRKVGHITIGNRLSTL